MKGVLLGVCCAIVVACAGASSRKASAPPPGVQPNLRSDPHAEIDALASQIASDRSAMGLGAEPPVSPMSAHVTAAAPPRPSADPSCHHGPGDTCTSSCTLADSICDNSTKICELAKQLPGDNWAAEKCSSGETSCKEAHDRCCACS